MCVAAAGLLGGLVSGLSAVAQYNAQVDDFNQQERMWKENYVNSLAAGREEQNQLTLRGIQEQEAFSQKDQGYVIEEAVATAEAENSAAAAGVGGVSVANLIQQGARSAGYNRYWARANYDTTAAQLTQEQRGTVTRIKQRINSVTRPVKPNPAGAMLSVIGGVLGGI
jgi:hypothetical protein